MTRGRDRGRSSSSGLTGLRGPPAGRADREAAPVREAMVVDLLAEVAERLPVLEGLRNDSGSVPRIIPSGN